MSTLRRDSSMPFRPMRSVGNELYRPSPISSADFASDTISFQHLSVLYLQLFVLRLAHYGIEIVYVRTYGGSR